MISVSTLAPPPPQTGCWNTTHLRLWRGSESGTGYQEFVNLMPSALKSQRGLQPSSPPGFTGGGALSGPNLRCSFAIAAMTAQSLERVVVLADAGESVTAGAAAPALASRPGAMRFATRKSGSVLLASCDRT
jgi:hypothetical protein